MVIYIQETLDLVVEKFGAKEHNRIVGLGVVRLTMSGIYYLAIEDKEDE